MRDKFEHRETTHKKIAFSFLATSALATIIAVGDAGASSYTVKSGDSLWKIASSNGTTVSQIKELNNLSNDLIFPNQSLRLIATTMTTQPTAVATNRPATTTTSSSTYTIKRGDTLSRITNLYNTSVRNIQNLNNITTHIIHPRQVLKLSGTVEVTPVAPSTPAPAPTPTPAVPTNPANTVYTIISGDTLSGIAYRHRTRVDQLLKWNNLTSTAIRVNQKLSIVGSGEVSPVAAPSSVPAPATPVVAGSSLYQKVIQLATPLQGTPYAWGGSSTAGYDYSGFIYYVYTQAGLTIPRTNTTGYDSRSYDVSDPQPGDLVFFANTYRQGISHMGIYIGNNQFIHAGGDQVQVTSLSNSYWKSKFDGFKRLYAVIDI